MLTNDRFMRFKVQRIDQDPSDLVLEWRFALVCFGATALYKLVHAIKAMLCIINNAINAVGGDVILFENSGLLVSKLNEVLKVTVTGANKLEADLDLVGNLIVVGSEGGYLAQAASGAVHDGRSDR